MKLSHSASSGSTGGSSRREDLARVRLMNSGARGRGYERAIVHAQRSSDVGLVEGQHLVAAHERQQASLLGREPRDVDVRDASVGERQRPERDVVLTYL